MQDLTLTRSFMEKWEQRVGNWPTAEAVRNYLEQSVQVQPCEDFIRQDGRPFRMLAIYWHPELDLVMKVDTKDRAAVTVFSRDRYVKREIPEIGNHREQEAVRPRLSFAARIARVRERFGLRLLGRRHEERKAQNA